MYAELEASGVGGDATARAGDGASANAAAPAATSAARRDDTAGDDEHEGSADAARPRRSEGGGSRGGTRASARAAKGVGATRATRMVVCRSEDGRVPRSDHRTRRQYRARRLFVSFSALLRHPPRPRPPRLGHPSRIFSARRDGQEQERRPGVVRRRRLVRRRPHAHPRAVRGRARAIRGRRGGGRGRGKSASSKSAAHKSVDASTSTPGAPTVEVARWDVDPRVHLLRFASAAARATRWAAPPSFSRTSTSRHRPERIPTGQRGGVANYSGHNMRARDLARFINRLREERPGGAAETPAEASLVAALSSCGALRSDKSGRVVAARDDLVVAAVAGSSDKNEVRDALLHEAMHMVFYVDEAFAERCWSFWRERATERDKVAWIAFLRDLRYNVDDEELVVNELQAYMCTERQMFGESGGGGRRGGRGGGGDDALASLQTRFAAYIREFLPSPPSVGAGTRVVWL